MASHPQVGGYGEVLLRGVEGWSDWPKGARDRPFYTTYLKDRRADRNPVRRHLMMFRYLDYLYEQRRGFAAIGFKLMYDQVWRHPEIILYLLLRRVRVVHLFRRNVLDIYLSREALLLRRFAHARAPEERESVRLRVDVNRIAMELRRLRREQLVARRAVRVSGLPACDVVYEDAVANSDVLQHTLSFLGIPPTRRADLSSVMLKLAPTSHRDSIENFDEVAAKLACTQFADCLRE